MIKYLIPIFLFLVILLAVKNKVPVYDTLILGGENGLKILKKILPTMIALLTAVSMMRGSGLIDWLVLKSAPMFELLNVPPEIISMIILKPISGSGAFAVLAENIKTYGVDSKISVLSCVIAASTETVLYMLAVYFSGFKKTHRILICTMITYLASVIVALILIK